MTKAQLAILPIRDGRKADRRIVNLAARLRDPGATLIEVDILNLSTDGFMARGAGQIEVGTYVWLRVTGLEPQSCRAIWNEEDRSGFEFTTPLHSATVELLIVNNRKPLPKNYFGPQGIR